MTKWLYFANTGCRAELIIISKCSFQEPWTRLKVFWTHFHIESSYKISYSNNLGLKCIIFIDENVFFVLTQQLIYRFCGVSTGPNHFNICFLFYKRDWIKMYGQKTGRIGKKQTTCLLLPRERKRESAIVSHEITLTVLQFYSVIKCSYTCSVQTQNMFAEIPIARMKSICRLLACVSWQAAAVKQKMNVKEDIFGEWP